MTDTELTYAALITLELPGMAQPATATVTLTPADAIAAGGRAKPLGDCTLADLQEFAGALEEEIWARYRTQQLIRLAEDKESHVKVTVLEGSGEAISAPSAKWLEHAILLSSEMASQIEDNGTDEPMPTERTVTEALAPDVTPAPALKAPEEETAPETPATAEPLQQIEEEKETERPDQETSPGEEEEALPTATVAEPATPAEPAAAPAAEPPLPAEIPVVDGAEPSTVPAEAETAPTTDIRILGLRRPVGHPTPAAVDILINEPAFRDAQEHALSSLDREVAGMLIGPRPEKQPDGRYVVHISDTIIARHTRMAGASVTYTPESWRHVTDVLTERYPNEEAVIVGWYHTHPGFGIFLSGMDLFIHKNFFTQKWHVALVLDPRARRSGFFCWDRPKSAVQPYDFPWPPWAPGSW